MNEMHMKDHLNGGIVVITNINMGTEMRTLQTHQLYWLKLLTNLGVHIQIYQG